MDDKIEITTEIQRDQTEWLEEMAKKYELPDSAKVLRVLLDYAMQDGDEDEIFDTIRCNHC
ncbi:MAG: hypothetical protein AAF702_06825 [Chloroflexota bacterium]